MFKLISSLFKSTRPVKHERSLTSLHDLLAGDMVKFSGSFGLPEDVRGETFRVQKISTYFFGDTGTPQFVIKSGDNKPIFLTIEDFDGEEHLVLSRKLKHKEVEALVGWNALKSAMKDDSNKSVQVQSDADQSGWLTNAYQRRVGGGEGVYFERDLRSLTSVPNGGEKFKYYEFYSDDEAKSLEVEVWEGDEYEVCIGLVRPFSDITEYWPSSL